MLVTNGVCLVWNNGKDISYRHQGTLHSSAGEVFDKLWYVFQGDGKDEEPFEWKHLVMGARQVYEQAIYDAGEQIHFILLKKGIKPALVFLPKIYRTIIKEYNLH